MTKVIKPAADRRLIEVRFPFAIVSEKSRKERFGKVRPPFWEMHYWWARRPLIASRAAIAAACLSTDAEEEFVELIRLREKMPYRENPLLKINAKLLDPFAGGGSIPFEALRLGCDTYAIEYNPIAYVILKASLEYPVKYGEQLLEDCLLYTSPSPRDRG